MGSEEDPQDDGGAGWQGVRTHKKRTTNRSLSNMVILSHDYLALFMGKCNVLADQAETFGGEWVGEKRKQKKEKTFWREIYGGRITHGQENQLLADIVS